MQTIILRRSLLAGAAIFALAREYNKNLRLILIYVVIAIVVYGLIYYVFMREDGSGSGGSYGY